MHQTDLCLYRLVAEFPACRLQSCLRLRYLLEIDFPKETNDRIPGLRRAQLCTLIISIGLLISQQFFQHTGSANQERELLWVQLKRFSIRSQRLLIAPQLLQGLGFRLIHAGEMRPEAESSIICPDGLGKMLEFAEGISHLFVREGISGSKSNCLLVSLECVFMSLVLRKEQELPGIAVEAFRSALDKLIEDNRSVFIPTYLYKQFGFVLA